MAEKAGGLRGKAVLAIAGLCWGLTLWDSGAMTGGMPMPGGWTMSMVWMPMAGQSRIGAGAMFGAMWLAMMVAMMLPSSLPMLIMYQRAVKFRGEPHPDVLMWIMAVGYFLVWTLFGVLAYIAGAAIADAAMSSTSISRVVPLAAGLGLVVGGSYQLTPWKAACLTHCRDPVSLIASHLHRGWRGAVALGVHHGLFCTGCCWALMVMQLVIGVMNLGAMAAIATVIALEKLVVRGPLIARVVGMAAIGLGVVTLARASFGLW
jgi:predicted metal-binding membrane protein